MIRSLLRASIQNATVTKVTAAAPVSIRIDPVLLRAAEILPFEEVEVVIHATGGRFRTYVEAGAEGSGEIVPAAGERNPVRAGDLISVLAFGLLHDGQTLAHTARMVTVDAKNQLLEAIDVPARA